MKPLILFKLFTFSFVLSSCFLPQKTQDELISLAISEVTKVLTTEQTPTQTNTDNYISGKLNVSPSATLTTLPEM
jgi:hypothetical protein